MLIYLAGVTAASALVYLGTLSVWVAVLTMTVKLLAGIIAIGILGGVGFVAWREYGKTITGKLFTGKSSAE